MPTGMGLLGWPVAILLMFMNFLSAEQSHTGPGRDTSGQGDEKTSGSQGRPWSHFVEDGTFTKSLVHEENHSERVTLWLVES